MIDRRDFLKTGGAAVAVLSLSRFMDTGCRPQAAAPPLPTTGDWEDWMRDKWSWDSTAFVTHPQDCYPGNCSWVGYIKNGVLWREEQTGRYPVVDPSTPDWNPRGCQKGCMYSRVTYGKERIKYPLKRVGPRGSGKWERISWEEAITQIADGIIDAIEEQGPESVITEEPPGEGGQFPHGTYAPARFSALLGGTMLDTDGLINDFNIGQYMTFGKFHGVSSQDDWFKAELTLIWMMNPVYTRIPGYHFISESRYNGGEIWTIAPDFSPSACHADFYVPVKLGADAALALGVARVMIEENLHKPDFIREQTDLPLLVRTDTKRYLRASDIGKSPSPSPLPHAGEGSSSPLEADQLYFWDTKRSRLAPAPQASLDLKGAEPALEGEFEVTLAGGAKVTVTPVFSLLKKKLLDEFPLERVQDLTGVHPDVVRTLARKIASKRTNILVGWCPPKVYHGDLIERSMCLCLALTGNWGKPGTGVRGWTILMDMLRTLAIRKPGAKGFEELEEISRAGKALMKKLPGITEEMAQIHLERVMGRAAGNVPPVFFWYHHAGYREVWNRKEWGDASMKRTFDEYIQEAIDKGWWDGVVRPGPDVEPRVLILCGSNTLRRTRGAPKRLLDHLWPKLKLIVSIDPRMSTSGLYSDLVLPAAFFYEKTQLHSLTTPHVRFWAFADSAIPPVHESKNEWDVFALLARKVGERAAARGLTEYRLRQPVNPDKIVDEFMPGGLMGRIGGLFKNYFSERIRHFFGPVRRYADLHPKYTVDGEYDAGNSEKYFEDGLTSFIQTGVIHERTNLKTLRRDGFVKMDGLGESPHGLNLATDVKPNETINPFSWHTEKKVPYPTYARRAQFYIDHPWFIEGGEELPTHKDVPKAGGDHPFVMTSGHLRWSIHGSNVANELSLALHRGEPFMFINEMDAREKGVKDGEYVRVFNDVDSFTVQAKLSALPARGQVIIYHAWDPYQFKGWKSYDTAIPGMVKWLHLAGGYGHLNFWLWNWQPCQSDRHIYVDFEKTRIA